MLMVIYRYSELVSTMLTAANCDYMLPCQQFRMNFTLRPSVCVCVGVNTTDDRTAGGQY